MMDMDNTEAGFLYKFEDAFSFFDLLNRNEIDYVVLRSYEEMHEKEYFTVLKKDVDILVKDIEKFAEISGIYQKSPDDNAHYVAFICGELVPIDVQYVGDSYFDVTWQKDMLKHRKRAANGNWFVLSDEDYYYSLVYHYNYHKNNVTNHQLNRLNKMAIQIKMNSGTKEDHLGRLQAFLRNHGYVEKETGDELRENRQRDCKSSSMRLRIKFGSGKLGSLLWDFYRRFRCLYYRRKYSEKAGFYTDLMKKSNKLERKIGINVYDILAVDRTSKYMNRYAEKVKVMAERIRKESLDIKHDEITETVFVLWLQGLKNAPSVVRACVSSIKEFANTNGMNFAFLDEENLCSYITIPPVIREKYKKGVIDVQQFSDIVRLLVLYNYGGLWVDADVLIPESTKWKPSNCFSLYLKKNDLNNRFHDFWWFYSKKRNELTLAVLASLLVWWENENTTFGLRILDICWKKSINESEIGRKIISEMPQEIDENAYLLLKAYNKAYDDVEWMAMKALSPAFKCSYKETGFASGKTYYCMLCDGKLK